MPLPIVCATTMMQEVLLQINPMIDLVARYDQRMPSVDRLLRVERSNVVVTPDAVRGKLAANDLRKD